MNSKTHSFSMLWRYLRPFKSKVFLLFMLILISIGLQLVAPQIIGQFLDEAQTDGSTRVLIQMGVIFFLVVTGQKIVELFSVYFGEDLGWAATNRLRTDLTAHCIRLDMGFHKLRTPGELIQRIDGDVSTLAEYFSSLVVQVLGNGLLVIGVLFLLFTQSWLFGLLGLLYAILLLGYQRVAIQPPMVPTSRAVRQGYTDLYSYLEERITGTEDIRANGGEAYVLHRLYPLMTDVTNQRLKQDLIGGFSFAGSHMLYVVALVAALAMSSMAYFQGNVTIGTVYMMVFYLGLLESPLKYIRRQLNNLQRAYASIDRIYEFFQIQPAVEEQQTAVLPPSAPTVQFDRVTFAYKDQPEETHTAVLSDISFALQSGKVLGLLGRTGSGKTSLTRLLFRLYDVDTGTITLDDVNVNAVALSDLRRHIGMVTQDVQLFAASIRDNLTLFRNYNTQVEPINDAQIIAAIETLGLKEWFDALPNGLDTMLQAGGKGLSAGESQLLAFTRVFLRDPQLVILDEASSRLDPATEQLLERAIDRLLQNRTGIIIAHRLDTVRRADAILILENGRVLEHGDRAQLVNDPNSRFSHLLQTGLEEVLV